MSAPRKKRTFKFVITKAAEANNAKRHIAGLDLLKKWEVIVKPYVNDRSIPQNKLAFKWYKERGEQNGNGSHYERLFCKFVYGCPLLVEQEEESGESAFTEFFMHLVKTYDFEGCINAMEFVEVTSIFKVKKFSKYLNDIEVASVEQDIVLTHPDDIYWQAMGIKK